MPARHTDRNSQLRSNFRVVPTLEIMKQYDFALAFAQATQCAKQSASQFLRFQPLVGALPSGVLRPISYGLGFPHPQIVSAVMGRVSHDSRQPSTKLFRVLTVVNPRQADNKCVLKNVFGVRGIADSGQSNKIARAKMSPQKHVCSPAIP